MTYLHSLRSLLGGGSRQALSGIRSEPTGNAVSTARLSQALGDKWRAYESLPTPVRQALAQANVDLCPHNILAAYQRVLFAARTLGLADEAAELYLEEFMKAQAGEIEQFSQLHSARYGRPTPHSAAGATMLTERTRRAPRRQLRRR